MRTNIDSSRPTIIMVPLFLVLVLLSCTSHAFVPPSSSNSKTTTTSKTALEATVVVISPPGGIGQEAAVQTAQRGHEVQWLVVSSSMMEDSTASVVALDPTANQQILDQNGSVNVAGASVDQILGQGAAETFASSIAASTTVDGLICTYDGCATEELVNPDFKRPSLAGAIRKATGAVSAKVKGPRVVVLPGNVEVIDKDEDENKGLGVAGLPLPGLGSRETVAKTLRAAAAATGAAAAPVVTLRTGKLFGTPSSDPSFSPLVGGVLREATLAKECLQQTPRLDPFLLTNSFMNQVETSRWTVAALAARLATNDLKIPSSSISLAVASQLGSDPLDDDQWQQEWNRATDPALASSSATSSLFAMDDLRISNVDRMSEWLATKWAPAVLRTYDIAAIRVGGRPVSITKVSEDTVELIWKDLKDLKPVVTGKLIVKVTPTSVTATRGAPSPTASVSILPLNGEDVLIRRLAEGMAQAMQKGLASKQKHQQKEVVTVAASPPPPKVETPVVETVPPPPPTSSAEGPRTAGARRSTKRQRGRKQKEE